MKNIEVPDELHEKLMQLSKEVKTQDNRHTANVFFQIEDIERVPAYDGCGNGVYWYDSGLEAELETDEEIKEFIIEYFSEELTLTEEEAKEKYSDMDRWDIDHMLENELEFIKCEYSNISVYKNAFLTAKDCDNHIELNKHHYSEKARSYGSSAWRNNDMEIIHEFLKTI